MATIINEVLLGRPSTAEVPAPEAVPNKSAAPDRRECLAQTACVFFPVRSSLLMKCPANYSGHHEENENMR
jgi:hypothetical protein